MLAPIRRKTGGEAYECLRKETVDDKKTAPEKRKDMEKNPGRVLENENMVEKKRRKKTDSNQYLFWL